MVPFYDILEYQSNKQILVWVAKVLVVLTTALENLNN